MKTCPVDRLLSATGVKPISFPRAATYAALYPGLAVFDVPPGALDLAKDLPKETVHTLAGTTTLVATEDLHGAMVEVLINVARDIQPRQSLESPEGVFPTTQHVSLPLDPRATRFYQDGPSKLSRHLPYWGSALLDQIVFVLIPAFAIVFTLLEAVPTLLGLKFSLRAQALTRKLAKVERSLIAGEDPQVLWEALEGVEGQSAELRVPRRKAGEFLELRQNIHDARERIEARDPAKSP
jgi:hypothetical protein